MTCREMNVKNNCNLLVILVSGVLLSGKSGFCGRNNEARAFRRASRALHCSSDNKPNGKKNMYIVFSMFHIILLLSRGILLFSGLLSRVKKRTWSMWAYFKGGLITHSLQ